MLRVQRSVPYAGVTTLRRGACKLRPRKYRLTTVNPPAYPSYIGKTVPIGFGDLRMLADNRLSAVFLRPCALARIQDQWVGLSGETFGSAGANVPVRQPRSVPAHPFGDGKRAFNTNVGGRIMRRILARFEQPSLPNILTQQFPLFATAGRQAAQLWLHGVPTSAGAYRDERYQRLVSSTKDFVGDEKRRAAFNDSFASELALSIARQSRAEVRHDR